ncbi:MAG: FIST C-terminal domain-containing protein, partial [Alphaproteobacteria bacterium]
DFAVGDRVQIMARDNGLMLDSVREGVAGVARRVQGRRILMSLYIDCAGRASARSGAAEEEAEIALRASASLGPFLGFYSGVEIAPVGRAAGAASSPLDWTAVMSALYWRD